MQNLDQDYWQNRYINEQTGWDVGFPSIPLQKYFDQLSNKDLKILIPGAGNAYEVEHLFINGFHNVYLLDWAKKALENFHQRNPEFPEKQLIHENFFEHQGQYDLIVEQTFFCALNPNLRENYVKKMKELLKAEGRLVGLYFGRKFEKEGPPFGADLTEYKEYFKNLFSIKVLEECYNSIPPRAGSELFAILHPVHNNHVKS